jgi:hypothetical protein
MNFPLEFQFLLLCVQPTLPAERLRELAGAGLDWESFFALAARHGVRPIVYENLSKSCWDLVPPDVQQRWREIGKAVGWQAFRAMGELLMIAAAFEKERVPVLPVKGPVLAQELYGSEALREFGDLDLLVHEADFLKATALLERLEYRTNWDVAPATKLQFLRYQGETGFTGLKSGLYVELHWRIAKANDALPLEPAFFWSRLRLVQFAGRELLGFAPEPLALFLAAQGGHDGWFDLRRVCDLAALVRKYPDVEWSAVLQEASRLHGLRVLLLGLRLALELLDAPLPEAVKKKIRDDPKLDALAAQSLTAIMDPIYRYDFKRLVFQIQVKEGLWAKLRLAFGLLTDRTDHDGRWLMLPRALWPLYRILRPLRRLRQAL